MIRFALALLLAAVPAWAQLTGNPLAAASTPTFAGIVTFTADPQVQASLNAGDIVCNGTGAEACVCHGGSRDTLACLINADCTGGGICGCFGFRVQADRPQTAAGTPVPPAVIGRQYYGGWSFDPANRSYVEEFIGDGVSSSKQYVFLNGHLGTSASFGTPVLTSTNTPAMGFEATDTNLSVIVAPTGANQSISRALSFTSAGVPIPPSSAEPLPTCAAAIKGAWVFDTTLSPQQLCVCNAVPRWCAASVPGCTTGTTTVCGTT